MEIEIESGIPMPQPAVKTTGLSAAARKMQVGDSVFLTGVESMSLGGRLESVKRGTGFKFSSRTVTENGVKGCRVWRTE